MLCNGSQGIVTQFCPIDSFPIVQFNNGVIQKMEPFIWLSETRKEIGVKQIPLILAWALTIHKIQGSALDAAEIDIGNEIGRAHV